MCVYTMDIICFISTYTCIYLYLFHIAYTILALCTLAIYVATYFCVHAHSTETLSANTDYDKRCTS